MLDFILFYIEPQKFKYNETILNLKRYCYKDMVSEIEISKIHIRGNINTTFFLIFKGMLYHDITIDTVMLMPKVKSRVWFWDKNYRKINEIIREKTNDC